MGNEKLKTRSSKLDFKHWVQTLFKNYNPFYNEILGVVEEEIPIAFYYKVIKTIIESEGYKSVMSISENRRFGIIRPGTKIESALNSHKNNLNVDIASHEFISALIDKSKTNLMQESKSDPKYLEKYDLIIINTKELVRGFLSRLNGISISRRLRQFDTFHDTQEQNKKKEKFIRNMSKFKLYKREGMLIDIETLSKQLITIINNSFKKINKNGKIIILDSVGFGNFNNTTLNQFREKNVYRVSSIIEDYQYLVRDREDEDDNYPFTTAKTNVYVLNKTNSTKTLLLNKPRHISFFDALYSDKEATWWHKNNFKKTFEYPPHEWYPDDCFTWDGPKFSKNINLFNNSYLASDEYKDFCEKKLNTLPFMKWQKSNEKEKNKINDVISNLLGLLFKDDITKYDKESEEAIDELKTIGYSPHFEILTFSHFNKSFELKDEAASMHHYLPLSSTNEIYNNLKKHGLSDFDIAIWLKEHSVYKQNITQHKEIRHEFLVGHLFLVNRYFSLDFTKDLDIIKNIRTEKGIIKEFNIMYLDIQSIDFKKGYGKFSSEEFTDLQIFTHDYLKKENGLMFIYCGKEILDSKEHIDIRENWTPYLEIILQLENKFLLVFRNQTVEKYIFYKYNIDESRSESSFKLFCIQYKEPGRWKSKNKDNWLDMRQEKKSLPATKEDLDIATKTINQNIDSVKDIITGIEIDVKGIKDKNLEVEKKLELIAKRVDSEIKNVDIQEFVIKVKEWFSKWDMTEEYTKTILPISEYLYDQLIDLPGTQDYSSFVAYSCQALELEVYSKIFKEFHEFIHRGYEGDKKKLCEYDENKISNNRTKENIDQLDKFFHNYILNEKIKIKYTLGGMIHIIKYLPIDGAEITQEYEELESLQLLNEFVTERMGEFDVDLRNKIFDFVKIRNKAAHPGEITAQEANQFWESYKDLVNEFMEKL